MLLLMTTPNNYKNSCKIAAYNFVCCLSSNLNVKWVLIRVTGVVLFVNKSCKVHKVEGYVS